MILNDKIKKVVEASEKYSGCKRVKFKSSYSDGTRAWICPRCNSTNITKFNIDSFGSEERFNNKPMAVCCSKCRKTSITDNR